MDINIRFMEQYKRLNNKKFLFLELKRINGLNKYTILKLFNLFNLKRKILVYQFKKDIKRNDLFIEVCKKLMIYLKVFIYQADKIKIKKLIYSYQGYRHMLSLPCRGQGTKRNGKTQKKRRKRMSNKFFVNKEKKKKN